MLSNVILLNNGQAYTINATNAIRLTVITGAGATAVISRVDSNSQTVDHTVGAENRETDVTANTKKVIDVDWPFYKVSVTGGSCRVALI